MKFYLVITALLFITTSTLASDEYEYIATPVSNQVADITDNDHDGVINARDKCPNTLTDAKIDSKGCSLEVMLEEKFILLVLFGNNSTNINPIFIPEIKQMALFIKRYPDLSVELRGYASMLGDQSHNKKLSIQRSEAVKRLLIQYGAAPTRITLNGLGRSELQKSGNTQQTQALNRRVTASIVGINRDIVKNWTIYTNRNK
jgi:outer membrane protein OmpA-like peptidoglycan-associated protein